MLTREEWQENPLVFIDSVMEAEEALRDQNELIKLMGKIIYYQTKIISKIPEVIVAVDTGFPTFQDSNDIIASEYVQKLMLQLPKDWTETLEV